MITLTDEQAMAAAATERLVYIVSAPGSGKTTVAAERFGFQRYQAGDRRGVLGLSFNRAAVAELSQRISKRWGERCVAFPHRVITFDHFHVDVLRHLMRTGLVKWPNGLQELDVRDDYRGVKGYRWLRPTGNYRRVAGITTNGDVVSLGIRVDQPGWGIGNIAQHQSALDVGVVSHDDVRQVLLHAMKIDDMKRSVSEWLATNYRAVIVDEVYDAAVLDLCVVYLAAESNLAVTVIGDPWQALYKWRGASPETVHEFLDATSNSFVKYEQTRSFRFKGNQMPALATALRSGDSVALPPGVSSEVDVALARNWAPLWSAGRNVLPLAFRTVDNTTDAALNLLLDVATRGRLGVAAFGRDSAIARLGLDRKEFRAEQDRLLAPLLTNLCTGRASADVLDDLRIVFKSLGLRKPGRLKEQNERQRIIELDKLAARMRQDSLVPGLTVFQAKGREWGHVGVVLTQTQESLLSAGLQALDDESCVIYVALTRAISRCVQLGGETSSNLEVDESSSLDLSWVAAG